MGNGDASAVGGFGRAKGKATADLWAAGFADGCVETASGVVVHEHAALVVGAEDGFFDALVEDGSAAFVGGQNETRVSFDCLGFLLLKRAE